MRSAGKNQVVAPVKGRIALLLLVLVWSCRSGMTIETKSNPKPADAVENNSATDAADGTGDATDDGGTDEGDGGEVVPPPEFFPLAALSGATGVQHGEVLLAWQFPKSTDGISKIVIVGKAGATIGDDACNDPAAVIATLTAPYEKTSWVDVTASQTGALFSYAACCFDVATNSLKDVKKVEAVQARDLLVNGSPSQLALSTPGPLDGEVTLHIDFPADVTDLARFYLVMADGSGAPADCNGAPIATFNTPAQFVTGDFSVATGKLNGETVSFRLCAVDVSGNVTSPLTIAGVNPKDTATPPAMTAFTVVNGAQGGYIDYSMTLPADISDYDTIELAMMQGALPAVDCTGATILATLTGPFVSPITNTLFVVGTDTFGFRACIRDTSGNLTSSDLVAPFYVPGCDAGYYNDGTACVAVGPGYFSPTDTLARFLCSIGFYCATPNNAAGTGDGGCSAGYFCPVGSSSSQQEDAGLGKYTTAAAVARSDCNVGRYCSTLNNTAGTGDGPCTAGYYCPAGSSSATQEDAGPGKYTTAAAAVRTDCDVGRYCSTLHNTAGTGDGPCSAGYYCPAGSSSATQEDAGAGKYTTLGAVSRTDCAAGRYCSTLNNTASTGDGPCTAGYYCLAGSPSATQNPSGAGYYTAAGASSAVNCGAGKFCPNAANAPADRADCAAGRYCSTVNNTTDQGDGPCTAGYYCPAGSISATANNCPIGSYCPAAAGAATACSNKPNYSSYTTANWTTSTCPYSCSAGHTPNGGECSPNCSITVGPAAWTTSSSAAFTISCTNIGTIQCSLDGGAYGTCTTPTSHSLTGLSNTAHTLSVRSTDGTVFGLPATYNWTVDTAAPTVTITTSNTTSYSPNWVFNSSDAGGGSVVSTQCKLDAGAYGACNSSTTHSYAGLGLGSHTFTVRVTDNAGNTGTDSRTWNYGTWYQAAADVCSTKCSSLGKVQALSPGGGYCVSGETQTSSAAGLISYTWGTWGVSGNYATNSVGGYCYFGGQGQDNDATDLTVGCFCK